jgi:CTP:molybdopterin cytidylyltransferase MocA
VLLAAGSGSRFSPIRSKLVAPFRGRPLAAWAIEAACSAAIGDVFVVTGAVDLTDVVDTVECERRPRIVVNELWSQGQATSIHAGIQAAVADGHTAVVVGLADQPLVPAEAWRLVAEAPPDPIVTATFAGQRRPPVRLDGEVWPLLPVEGDEGARAVMRMRPELVTEVPCPGEPVDIDTVEDLDRWS